MSIQTSRFENQQIVNNFNLFVDSDKASLLGHANSKGDDLEVHLEGNSVSAEDGELIRLTLSNFTMFNNVYNINNNNSKFRLRVDGGNELLNITHKNYSSARDIALELSSILLPKIQTAITAAGGNSTLASSGTSITSTLSPADGETFSSGNGLLNITYVFSAGHRLTTLLIQCNENDGDSYAIFGGERLDNDSGDANTTFSSLQVDISTTSTTVEIKGYFRMQTQTDPNVYLRVENTSTNLEMSSLTSPTALTSTSHTDVIHGNILAKIPRDSEIIKFNSGVDEFFMNLQQRRLSTLRLRLTDKNGRPLGRNFSDRSNGTSSGLESSGDFVKKTQSTLGNLSFNAVIRIEVVKVRIPRKLDTEPLPKPLPARKAQSTYVWEDYGNPKY